MTDTLIFGGKTLTSSKRAAEESGYAQDYIGQLARKGLIAAERVGNLWYVSMESLNAYKAHAESYVPDQPQALTNGRDADSYISFDGKDYISASRGSKLSGYNQDYIGQLARGGKILSRQVGNRWYVDRESLLAHKREKDALLAAVQSESVGLARVLPTTAPDARSAPVSEAPEHHFRYYRDSRELLPITKTEHAPSSAHMLDLKKPNSGAVQPVSRAVEPPIVHIASMPHAPVRRRKVWHNLAEAAVALTVVIMLSYGFVSIQDGALYALKPDFSPSSVASSALAVQAAEVMDSILDVIESVVVPELIYTRDW